jgi:AcrR family transcriptional regulator
MASPQSNVSKTVGAAKGTTAERLWAVAAQLFREKGYHASTTRDLADRLDITKASLYYHVSKKEDLLYGICVQALEHVTQAVQAALAEQSDPLQRIRALVHAQLASSLTELDLHATMLLNLDQLTGDHLVEVLKLRNRYEDLVRSVVSGAQKAGALRDDISARNLTLVLLNMINWTLTWYKPAGQLLPAGFAAVIADVYLDGAAVT